MLNNIVILEGFLQTPRRRVFLYRHQNPSHLLTSPAAFPYIQHYFFTAIRYLDSRTVLVNICHLLHHHHQTLKPYSKSAVSTRPQTPEEI